MWNVLLAQTYEGSGLLLLTDKGGRGLLLAVLVIHDKTVSLLLVSDMAKCWAQ